MQEMNWISVKDKLPPYGVYGTRTKRVTHWMPLPEPPKEVYNHDQG